MVKAHSPINWQNEPSFNTPINETNLNKMDSTIGVLDDRIIEQDTSKLDKSTAYTMVKDISFNENNGIFTVTRLNGSTFTIDTRLEKIAINFKYDYSTQKLIITLIDGTTQSIDMSALVTQYEFADSATLNFSVGSDGKITATIKNGSITEDMLQPNYLAEIKVETEKSAQSMANAQTSENNAKQSELNAKASEEQALEYSNNAQPLAQSVSGTNPTATNSTDGKVIYLENSGYTSQDGEPTPDNPIHIGGLADKGYFDGDLLQGWYGTDGVYIIGKSVVCSQNKIKCNGGDVVKLSTTEKAENNRLRFYYYNNDTYISSEYADLVSEFEVTIPSNANNFAFSIATIDNTDYLISDAKHICVTINGQYALRVKTCNKNLFDEVNLNRYIYSTTVGADLTTTSSTRYCVSDLIDGSKDLTISFLSGEVTSLVWGITNGKIAYYISPNKGTVFEGGQYDYWVVGFGMIANTTITTDILRNNQCMVEEGTVATPYEPHQETEALIPVSAPFYNGDYIKFFADGSGQIVRESVRFNPTSISNVREFTEGVAGVIALSKGHAKERIGKCNYLVSLADKSNGSFYFGDNATGRYSSMFFFIDGLTTKEEYQAWLDEHSGFEVVYKLTTPTSTPLTQEQVAEFLKLRTYNGVTYVNADGEVVMRYYANTDSGETVSMLQGMVEETKEAVSKVENLGNAFEVFDVTSASISVSSGQTNTIMLPISADGYTALGVVGASSDTDGVDIGGITMDIDRVTAYVKATNHTSATKSAKVTIQVLYIK